MERSEKVQAETLKVSEDVIATITRLATMEIKGVDGIITPNATLKQVFIKKTENNAIKIRLVGDVVEITLNVLVRFGHNVVSIAEQIQNNVKSTVQNMTGVTVSRVNVGISGVIFNDTKKN